MPPRRYRLVLLAASVAACRVGTAEPSSGTFGFPLTTAATGDSDPTGDDASATSTAASTETSGLGASTGDDSTTAAVADDTTEGRGDPTTAEGGDAPACPGPADPIDCSPGPGSGEADTCTDDPSCFLNLVKSSVNAVITDTPAWFDLSDGQPYVLEVEPYMNEVVARVSAAGQCAIRDPNAGDEIVVKHDNAFAENFDILTAAGYARYGDGIYTSKCIPAWF